MDNLEAPLIVRKRNDLSSENFALRVRKKRERSTYSLCTIPLLKKENTNSYESQDQSIVVGSSSCTGSRYWNEDNSTILLDQKIKVPKKEVFFPSYHFFGVYDGHAGNLFSYQLSRELHHKIHLEELENLSKFLFQNGKPQRINKRRKKRKKKTKQNSQLSVNNVYFEQNAVPFSEIKKLFQNKKEKKNNKNSSQKEKKEEIQIFGSNKVLEDAHLKLDHEFQKFEKFSTGGSCSTSVLVVPYQNFYEIITMNVGDSKSFLCCHSDNEEDPNTRLTVRDLSKIHGLDNQEEKLRVLQAGGIIGNSRINNLVNMTRTFGNFQLKKDPMLNQKNQILVATPEISRTYLSRKRKDQMGNEEIDFLIISCDGLLEQKCDLSYFAEKVKTKILEQIKNQKNYLAKRRKELEELLYSRITEYNIHETKIQQTPKDEAFAVQRLFVEGIELSLIASDLINDAILKGSKDNISVIIVLLNYPEIKQPDFSFDDINEIDKIAEKELQKLARKSKNYFSSFMPPKDPINDECSPITRRSLSPQLRKSKKEKKRKGKKRTKKRKREIKPLETVDDFFQRGSHLYNNSHHKTVETIDQIPKKKRKTKK